MNRGDAIMERARMTRVKVCCIMDHEEAACAVRAGADALGLVSAMPSGPGPIADDLIAAIARRVPPAVSTFVLTSRQSVQGIVDQHRFVRTSTIQIVDALTDGTYGELREQLPGVKLVQVIHVTGPGSVEETSLIAPQVDAVLLDSGRPAAAVKELGGTGRQHNWSISRAIRESIDTPLFLAGGLHAGNVRDAIDQVGPFGVDVCSGVRTNGRLDADKLAAFMEAVRGSAAP
jgi:phosphoribosylanthranilate isomerase